MNTEIWGSTTVNLNRGYVFQIFGGSEEGGIGNGNYNEGTGKIEYTYDARNSTYINLKGPIAGVSRKESMSEDIAECEFMYGGGFLGPVAGNCIINLNNGRIFDSFAGACNADILGHTETYIGVNGFPYVRDFVYGGNDLGGKILGTANFNSRLRNDAVRGKVSNTDMLDASAYMEYVQGRVEKIFGGAYGVYDYKAPHYGKYFYATGGEGTTPENEGHARPGYHKPFLENAFINFRPNESNNALNTVEQIYGAGQGYLGEEEEDLMQNRSYILIDVPQAMTTFQGTEVFGAGESGGVGMGVEKATADASATAHKASAILVLPSVLRLSLVVLTVCTTNILATYMNPTSTGIVVMPSWVATVQVSMVVTTTVAAPSIVTSTSMLLSITTKRTNTTLPSMALVSVRTPGHNIRR